MHALLAIAVLLAAAGIGAAAGITCLILYQTARTPTLPRPPAGEDT